MQRAFHESRDLFGNESVASRHDWHLPIATTKYRFFQPPFITRFVMKLPARFLLTGLAGLLLAGCYQVPVTGRRAMNLVDDKEVTKMSISMFDDMKKRYRPSRDKERNEQLQRVGERISKVVFWDMPDADWEFVAPPE